MESPIYKREIERYLHGGRDHKSGFDLYHIAAETTLYYSQVKKTWDGGWSQASSERTLGLGDGGGVFFERFSGCVPTCSSTREVELGQGEPAGT